MPKFLIILFIFVNILPVYGLDLPVSQITDDSILRSRLRDSWFIDTPRRVLSFRTTIESLETGERVEVRAVDGRNEIMILLSREMTSGRIEEGDNPALERRPTGRFPGYAQGSWMLTRNKSTGAPSLIRIFLRSDQSTYIQFRPYDTDKCRMDAVVHNGYLARSLPVAVPFERLYTMQLNDILSLVEGKFPLHYYEPDPVVYRDTRTFISQVRRSIAPLRFADDGAIDENGNYVLIKTLQPQNPAGQGLNCSGFTKWLIDGILRPVTGRRLTIEPLRAPFGQRGSSFTANWEERRDPFFGLDWIRNLAAEANGTLRSPGYSVLEEFEVNNDVFAYVRVSENRTFVDRSYPGFLREAGYGVEGLRPLLYTLAVDDPFSFYLAAVSNDRDSQPPNLRQYFHVAALVPYFDEYGTFRITVFESAEETSINNFVARYPGHYVNLVRIPVRTAFDP
ncbi:MAG: hypothetical protein FWB83_01830 [Treponema sp.]|nr:hypothetical protein [Treponema sp.]